MVLTMVQAALVLKQCAASVVEEQIIKIRSNQALLNSIGQHIPPLCQLKQMELCKTNGT